MSEANDKGPIDVACQVCGRRLLPGERAFIYVTRSGDEAVVCELCRPRAEASGWMLPEEAAAARAAGEGIERRPRSGPLLGGLGEILGGREGGRRGGRRRPAESGEFDREMPMPASHRDSGSIDLGEHVSAFNHSNHRRTVRGMSRSLGAPRASGHAVKTKAGGAGVRLTVCWELAWYQWEIVAGDSGWEVRESGRGESVDQLRAADRNWNLEALEDGTLRRKAAA